MTPLMTSPIPMVSARSAGEPVRRNALYERYVIVPPEQQGGRLRGCQEGDTPVHSLRYDILSHINGGAFPRIENRHISLLFSECRFTCRRGVVTPWNPARSPSARQLSASGRSAETKISSFYPVKLSQQVTHRRKGTGFSIWNSRDEGCSRRSAAQR